MDTLVIALDRKGRIVLFSDACAQITGFSFAEVRERPIWDALLPPAEVVTFKERFGRLLGGSAPLELEHQCRTKARDRVLLRWLGHGLADGDGVVHHVIGTGVDATAQRRAERALDRRNDELQRANEALRDLHRSRDELLAKVSHELRTPLVTGLGYLDLLVGGRLGDIPEETCAQMQIALKNLRRLPSLIDDILTYNTTAQRGHVTPLRLCSTDLGEVCREVVEEFLIRHPVYGARVRLDLPDTRVLVRANPDALIMVLSNLLENAGRHAGAEARITLCVDASLGHRVSVCVADNGTGMEPDLAQKVFEPFFQAGLDRSGSGLGLAIVNEYLAQHRTTPEIDSEPGRGTRVSFSLERSSVVAASPPDSPLPDFPLPGAEILNQPIEARIHLVEDDRDTAELLVLTLESAGYHVTTTSTAEVTLELLTASVPDLFLLDLSLPGMDGITLCRRLKSTPNTFHVPVLMLTAHAEIASRIRAESEGANGYLVKPVDTAALLKAVRSALAMDPEQVTDLERRHTPAQ